ncbi:MAG: glycosyltransferase family 4 protein, partial [Fibrobacter sp.]|nr:glycosyltransferase family 4 protein [Fibrobacter sp.]
MSQIEKKKVLLITHDLDLGGLQRVVVTICRTLDRSRFDVSVLCMRKAGLYVSEIEKLGIPVILIPVRSKGTDYFASMKVAAVFRKLKPDVIHTHNTQPFIEGTIAAVMTGVKRVIHTDHARIFPDKRRYMLMEWLLSHFVEKVVGVSEHTTKSLNKYEHISEKKLTTIVNGIEYESISVNIELKKKTLSLPSNCLVIGAAVRLSEQKGLHYVIEVLPDLIKNYPHIEMVIAGDGPLRMQLQVRAKELKIDKKVHFIGPRLDVLELLQVFDIYVLPSLWEGLPMIILEAMASGCPVIATDVGGVREAIVDNETGILVEPGNKKALYEAIEKLVTDKDLRKKLGV